MKYFIYNGNRLLGWSLLESGDPPMGVASGVFHPSEHYTDVQPLYQSHFKLGGNLSPESWEEIYALDLKAISETGEVVEPRVGIHITDATEEMADEPLQVEIYGVDGGVYERLFPLQHRAYWGE